MTLALLTLSGSDATTSSSSIPKEIRALEKRERYMLTRGVNDDAPQLLELQEKLATLRDTEDFAARYPYIPHLSDELQVKFMQAHKFAHYEETEAQVCDFQNLATTLNGLLDWQLTENLEPQHLDKEFDIFQHIAQICKSIRKKAGVGLVYTERTKTHVHDRCDFWSHRCELPVKEKEQFRDAFLAWRETKDVNNVISILNSKCLFRSKSLMAMARATKYRTEWFEPEEQETAVKYNMGIDISIGRINEFCKDIENLYSITVFYPNSSNEVPEELPRCA